CRTKKISIGMPPTLQHTKDCQHMRAIGRCKALNETPLPVVIELGSNLCIDGGTLTRDSDREELPHSSLERLLLSRGDQIPNPVNWKEPTNTSQNRRKTG